MFSQGDTVIVPVETENIDPRMFEPDVVPVGTVARIAGWRGLDGVVLTWDDDGHTWCAVVPRSAIRPAPRAVGRGQRPVRR